MAGTNPLTILTRKCSSSVAQSFRKVRKELFRRSQQQRSQKSTQWRDNLIEIANLHACIPESWSLSFDAWLCRCNVALPVTVQHCGTVWWSFIDLHLWNLKVPHKSPNCCPSTLSQCCNHESNPFDLSQRKSSLEPPPPAGRPGWQKDNDVHKFKLDSRTLQRSGCEWVPICFPLLRSRIFPGNGSCDTFFANRLLWVRFHTCTGGFRKCYLFPHVKSIEFYFIYVKNHYNWVWPPPQVCAQGIVGVAAEFIPGRHRAVRDAITLLPLHKSLCGGFLGEEKVNNLRWNWKICSDYKAIFYKILTWKF